MKDKSFSDVIAIEDVGEKFKKAIREALERGESTICMEWTKKMRETAKHNSRIVDEWMKKKGN